MEAVAPLLEVSGLGRQLGERCLWRGLAFVLIPGERVAVVGPSGSGKTLLLRMLAGLDGVDEGEISALGKPQRAWQMPAYRATVMYLHQTASLMEGTVEDNLSLPFALRVRRAPFPREQAIALLATFEREADFLARSQADLSGGERQMVGLIRALLLAPRVLLLDECTAAMDPTNTLRAELLVNEWLATAPGRACLWVSHDPAQRGRVASRELTLTGG